MNKTIITLLILLMLFVLNISGRADVLVGKDIFELSGGDKGDITFPHDKHQKAIKDCMVCHNMFAKKSGAISEIKVDGKLQNKEVMNHCIACHREMKKAGEKTGPISCSQCHKKP